MFYIVGLRVLSLLITSAIVIAFLFSASRLAYWLVKSPSMRATKMRMLLKPLLEGTNQDTATDTSNDGCQHGRQKRKCLIYRLHPIQSIQKLHPLLKTREWGIDNFTRTGEDRSTHQKKHHRNEHPETSAKGFVSSRPFPHWRPFSKSCHIRTIVDKLRR